MLDRGIQCFLILCTHLKSRDGLKCQNRDMHHKYVNYFRMRQMTNDIDDPGSSFPIHGPDEISVYKNIDGKDLKAHIFNSKSKEQTQPFSAFIFFHPGGWSMGEPMWGYELCSYYSLQGMVAISFEYRLSSIGGFSPVDALKDVKSAIRWTRINKEKLNIDHDRVAAGAISAGAHLAACAASIDGYDDPQDDKNISSVPNALALQSACLNTAIVGEFTHLLQGRDDPENLSPYHHLKSGLPPMCLIHGTADDLISFDSIKEYAEKSIELGNRCDLHPFEGTDHFFSQNADSGQVFSLIDDFFVSLGYF